MIPDSDEYIDECYAHLVVTLDANGNHRTTSTRRALPTTTLHDDTDYSLPQDEPPGWANP